jgi:cardiolipin synthase
VRSPDTPSDDGRPADGAEADPAAADRPAGAPQLPEPLVTIPNVLTFVRLLSLPLFVWLLVAEDRRVAAAVYLAVIASTDWFDGWIARRYDQGTRFGKLFDPTVDRILFVVTLATIISVDGIPLWFAVAVLVRELSVSAVTVFLVLSRYEPVDVTWFGKAGTFGLLTAVPLFLAGSDPGFPEASTTLAWLIGIPSLALSYYSVLTYLPEWRATVAAGRRPR